MSGFPLYDNLIKNLPKKDLNVKQKNEFIKNLEAIGDQGKERIYALVHFYYTEENELKQEETLPYKGACSPIDDIGNTNITWVLTNFPIKLRQLLYKFIKLHIKSIEEYPVR